MQRPASSAGAREKTYFEQQREALIGDIALVRIYSPVFFFSSSSLDECDSSDTWSLSRMVWKRDEIG